MLRSIPGLGAFVIPLSKCSDKKNKEWPPRFLRGRAGVNIMPLFSTRDIGLYRDRLHENGGRFLKVILLLIEKID